MEGLATVSRGRFLLKSTRVSFEEKLLIALCKRSFFVLSQTVLEEPGDSEDIGG